MIQKWYKDILCNRIIKENMSTRQKALIPTILKNQAPILEALIDRIAEDLDLDAKTMKKKYLNELRSYKKKVSRR